jgi:hypothetical protein
MQLHRLAGKPSWWGVVALTAIFGLSSPATAQQPAAPPAQPAAQAAPAPAQGQAAPGLAFGSDAGVIINYIKPDKTADFEEVVGKIKEALAKSENPVRKQQAAGWKVFKAVEPGPNGNVIYFFIVDPVVKDADYGMAKILTEGFPAEARALWDKLTPAYVSSSKLNLQLIQKFGQ